MGRATATPTRTETEEAGEGVATPSISPEALTLIADLEAQLEQAVGDARRPLRRKLRNLRRGAGIPMSRLRSTVGGGRARTGKKALSVRLLGESLPDSQKRLTQALRAAGLKQGLLKVGDGYAFPVDYPADVLLAKVEHLTGARPTKYGLTGKLVVFWL